MTEQQKNEIRQEISRHSNEIIRLRNTLAREDRDEKAKQVFKIFQTLQDARFAMVNGYCFPIGKMSLEDDDRAPSIRFEYDWAFYIECNETDFVFRVIEIPGRTFHQPYLPGASMTVIEDEDTFNELYAECQSKRMKFKTDIENIIGQF